MSSRGALADGNETSIRLMGAADAELPGAVTNEISLPAALSVDSVAFEKAKNGLETANYNRTIGRETGLSNADTARENAAENRANNSRSEDRSDGTDRPDPQGPPGGA